MDKNKRVEAAETKIQSNILRISKRTLQIIEQPGLLETVRKSRTADR